MPFATTAGTLDFFNAFAFAFILRAARVSFFPFLASALALRFFLAALLKILFAALLTFFAAAFFFFATAFASLLSFARAFLLNSALSPTVGGVGWVVAERVKAQVVAQAVEEREAQRSRASVWQQPRSISIYSQQHARFVLFFLSLFFARFFSFLPFFFADRAFLMSLAARRESPVIPGLRSERVSK